MQESQDARVQGCKGAEEQGRVGRGVVQLSETMEAEFDNAIVRLFYRGPLVEAGFDLTYEELNALFWAYGANLYQSVVMGLQQEDDNG